MNKQIYIGSTPLIDLSGYATESYVDTAVSNVDVTDQLNNYVQKTALDASYGALDASIKSSDASIASLKSILGQITGDGAEVTTAIDTFNELKAFVQDYTTSNDLSTLIASVRSQAVADASADAASKYQPIGSYLVADDISTFVNAGDVATAINSSIEALNLATTYQPIGNYLVADDISTFVDAAAVASAINSSITALDLANTYQAKGEYLVADDISTFITSDDISTFVDSATVAATYETKNDASNHVAGAGVTNIVTISAADYALLDTKSATTLYIVSE